MPETTPPSRVRLVVVTGSGRSGTSTVAGALKRLGLYVPQPEQPPDETNPRGFYEPQWVVEFHKKLLNSAPARTNDARPSAMDQVRAAASAPEVRDQLRAWLGEQKDVVGDAGQLVIKDPRTFWAHELWSDVCDDLAIDLCYLTMLRHPAEVIQSRDTHYLAEETEEFRRIRQTGNLAGWVNSAYFTEVATRSRPRAFVRYVDLLADWRTTMTRAQSQLGLRYNADLAAGGYHDVDDFIDVKLHRSQGEWNDVDTMPQLRDMAVRAWDASNALVDDPSDTGAAATLAEVHREYAALHEWALGIALDHTNISVAEGRRAARAKRAAAKGSATSAAPAGSPTARRRSRLPWKR